MSRLENLKCFLKRFHEFRDKEYIASLPLKHLGLLIPSPIRKKNGAKKFQDFLLEDDRKAVRIYYSDVIENGEIVKIKKRCVYYSDFDRGLGKDGGDFIWHIKIEHELVRDEIALKRSRYKHAYSDLLREGIKNDNPAVRTAHKRLIDYFLKEIQQWLLGNPQPFLDKLNSTNLPADVSAILASNALANSVKTVKDGIIERVSGVDWVEPAS